MSEQKISREDREGQIVALLQSGNTQAINLLVEHYSAALNGIVRRIIRQESLAEEVLQDVFLKIWNNADKYDPSKGRLFTWMANIAKRTAIDQVRSARFKREAKTDELETSVYEDTLPIHTEIQDSGLRNVISSLDERQVKVVDMVYFQGYSHRDLAKELDIPLGTVKSRLRIAMRELRKKLSGDMLRGLLTIVFILMFISIILNQ